MMNATVISTQSKRIYISNLPPVIEDGKLWTLFEPFGKVVEAQVVRDKRKGLSRGFGFVTFELEEQAAKAVEAMKDYSLDERVLNVQLSFSTGPYPSPTAPQDLSSKVQAKLVWTHEKHQGVPENPTTSPHSVASGSSTPSIRTIADIFTVKPESYSSGSQLSNFYVSHSIESQTASPMTEFSFNMNSPYNPPSIASVNSSPFPFPVSGFNNRPFAIPNNHMSPNIGVYQAMKPVRSEDGKFLHNSASNLDSNMGVPYTNTYALNQVNPDLRRNVPEESLNYNYSVHMNPTLLPSDYVRNNMEDFFGSNHVQANHISSDHRKMASSEENVAQSNTVNSNSEFLRRFHDGAFHTNQSIPVGDHRRKTLPDENFGNGFPHAQYTMESKILNNRRRTNPPELPNATIRASNFNNQVDPKFSNYSNTHYNNFDHASTAYSSGYDGIQMNSSHMIASRNQTGISNNHSRPFHGSIQEHSQNHGRNSMPPPFNHLNSGLHASNYDQTIPPQGIYPPNIWHSSASLSPNDAHLHQLRQKSSSLPQVPVMNDTTKFRVSHRSSEPSFLGIRHLQHNNSRSNYSPNESFDPAFVQQTFPSIVSHSENKFQKKQVPDNRNMNFQ